jgi:hypothetical protein
VVGRAQGYNLPLMQGCGMLVQQQLLVLAPCIINELRACHDVWWCGTRHCVSTQHLQPQPQLGAFASLHGMLRSYHPEKTRSHQNSEVNLDWAASVLGREITWEPAVS